MTGNNYSEVRRSIAKLFASQDGRDALAFNDYKSGTPIVPALEDESLGDFYKRVDEAAGPERLAIAAVLINGQLRMAGVTPAEGRKDLTTSEDAREVIPTNPQTTVGMLFTMLASRKQIVVKTQSFEYDKYTKVATPFEMPHQDGSLQLS